MPTKEEINQQVIARISARTGPDKPCALCGHNDWGVHDQFVTIPVTSDPDSTSIMIESPMLPSAIYFCLNCGNTHFLNLLVLGFDLAALKADDGTPGK